MIVTRGRKVAEFSITPTEPENAVLLEYMLGPTGNLRAPVVRMGKTLVVGFNEGAYRKLLGSVRG